MKPTVSWADGRWLFFDLGNTLISEDEPVKDRIEGLVGVLGGRGIHVSYKEAADALLRASAEFAPRPLTRVIEQLVTSEADREYILRRLTYRKELERPYPGAGDLLSGLSARYRIGVIANQPPGKEARLRGDGLTPYLSVCLFSAELGLHKPDPAIFRLALRKAGCEPHEAVMIGDRIDNDIRPAKALGWKTIRVLQGIARVQRPREPLEEADRTVEGLMQVETVLAPLFRE